MIVLRPMKADEDGLPKPGWSARTLGARCNVDVPTTEDGSVRPQTGGMSVSPPPVENLPPFRRNKDPIYELDTDRLPEDLAYRPDPQDPEGHGFVEPSRPMTFGEYQDALHSTRELWK